MLSAVPTATIARFAAACGVACAAINLYAGAVALAGRTPSVPAPVLLAVVASTLVCFTIALLRLRRERNRRHGHLDLIERTRADQRALRQAIPRGPWAVLFGWAALCFYAQATVPALQTGPPDLLMTAVLGAFAFAAWALLRFDMRSLSDP